MGADLALVGRTEEITGRWRKGKRDRFIVATKARGAMGPSPWDQGASRKHLLDAIDGSLKRLGTDYIDLYQLHVDDAATPLDEAAETLDHIVRSGKVRYIGVSNILAYRLARTIGRQDTLRLARFVSVQPRYSLLFREIERELLPLALEEGLAVFPFNPLAGGLLTGKYHHDEKSQTGRFSAEVGAAFGAMYTQRYWSQREFETVEKLAKSRKGSVYRSPDSRSRRCSQIPRSPRSSLAPADPSKSQTRSTPPICWSMPTSRNHLTTLRLNTGGMMQSVSRFLAQTLNGRRRLAHD
jgi:aryl-alcohol dehydrogenase-like predicted oxidoreductase